jgi:hypothetical protein
VARTDTIGTIYLLHLERPYKHAQHYMGWALDLEKRLPQHGGAAGSPLLAAAKAAGIGWELVRTWQGVTRHRERQLKRQGGHARRCPRCGVGGGHHRAPGATRRSVA